MPVRIVCSQLESGAVRLLAGIVKFNTALEELNLANCGVEPSSAAALAQGLMNNRSLRDINLAKNPLCDPAQMPIDDKGLLQLAESIRWSFTLQARRRPYRTD